MGNQVSTSLKSLAKSTSIELASSMIGMGLWFASKLMIIKATTAAELGLYSLVVAVISITALLGTMGLHNSSTRYISIFRGKGKEDEATRVAMTCIRMSVVFGLSVTVLLYFSAEPLARHFFYNPAFAELLKVAAPFNLFYISSLVMIGVVRGYGDLMPRIYFQNMANPLFFIFFAAYALFFSYGVKGLVISYTMAAFFFWVCVDVYSYLRHRVKPFYLESGRFRMEIISYSLPLLLLSLFGILFTYTDTIMLSRYLTQKDVGIYNYAVPLGRLLIFACSSAGFVLMPLAGELYAKKMNLELFRVYKVTIKWIVFVTFPLFLVLFLFPEMSLMTVFGAKQVVAAPVLRVLSFGYMFPVLMGLSSMMMMVMGQQKKLLYTSMGAAILNVILNYVFIKHLDLGLLGASWATAISFFTVNTLNTIILYRYVKVQPFSIALVKPLLAAFLVSMPVYLTAKALPFHLWLVPIYFIVFVTGYAGAILLGRGVEQEDIDLYDSLTLRVGVDLPVVRRMLMRWVH